MQRGGFASSGTREVARRVRNWHLLIGLLVMMFAAEATMHLTHFTWSRWIIAAAAVIAVGLAVGSGLRADDLGFGRDTWATGARWAGGIAAVVVVVIAAAMAIPPVRDLFLNDAYRDLDAALVSAFVLIPLQTVIPEELLFRGAVTGALLRRMSAGAAVGVQAVIFGLWHIISSTGLAAGNDGIGDVVGSGTAGTVLGVLAAVAFTGIAGVVLGWLRVRTGSILPCIALHWAANGAGAIAAALAWQLA